MEPTDGVETFVGIDAHSRQCSIKAISKQGKELLLTDVPTRPADLRRAFKHLPRPLWAMLESSCMAPYVKDSIGRSADRVIVCETRENRWIARSENKGDQFDADRLCRLPRIDASAVSFFVLTRSWIRLEGWRPVNTRRRGIGHSRPGEPSQAKDLFGL